MFKINIKTKTILINKVSRRKEKPERKVALMIKSESKSSHVQATLLLLLHLPNRL